MNSCITCGIKAIMECDVCLELFCGKDAINHLNAKDNHRIKKIIYTLSDVQKNASLNIFNQLKVLDDCCLEITQTAKVLSLEIKKLVVESLQQLQENRAKLLDYLKITSKNISTHEVSELEAISQIVLVKKPNITLEPVQSQLQNYFRSFPFKPEIEYEKVKDISHSLVGTEVTKSLVQNATTRLAATLSFEEIEEQLKELMAQFSPEDLAREKSFGISVVAKSALSILNSMQDDKFYVGSTPCKEVIWIFRLFLQFTGESLPDCDTEAWPIISNFISNIRNEEKHGKLINNVLLDRIAAFNFTNENIDKVELIINRQKLDPRQFTGICPVSALLTFAIREALIYAAVIKEAKVSPYRLHCRLLHKLSIVKSN